MKKILIVLILFLPLASILKGQADEGDSLALVAIYNSTNGPAWSGITNWLQPGKLVSEWEGVFLNGEGRVWRLNLLLRNMSGELPPEIGNLTMLDLLDLQHNNLTGTIPEEIGNLVNLNYLILYENEFSGTIPEEIGNDTSLLHLNIENNHFTGPLPDEIGNLTNLETLYCAGNQITGSLPSEMGTFQNLEVLSIYNNYFNGPLPEGIIDLPLFNTLYIESNYFTFADLEPFIGTSIEYFGYNTQRQVPVNTYQVNYATGDNLEFDITVLTKYDVEATNNQYQWWKNDASLTSYSTSPHYTLSDLDNSDEGYFYCTIINSDWPEMVLTTDSIKLVIDGPTNIQLSQNTVNENSNPGTVIGVLTVTDPDQESGHILSFVEGDGENDADNSLFSLNGENLLINVSPDYETQEEYHIYMRATDDDMKTLDKAFVISVNDIDEPDALRNEENNVNYLGQNHPNPFMETTTIEFKLPVSGQVVIEFFDMQGRLIESYTGFYAAGMHSVEINLKGKVKTGVYLYRMKTQGHTDSNMCIVR